MLSRRAALSLGLLLALLPAVIARAEPAADAAGIEFFENKVRPVLAEHCFRCHGPKQQEGSLRLDRVGSMLAGGDRGPALVAGDPEKSLLISAIGYKDQDLQMPPKGRLSDQQIADLVAWVRRGAPAPVETGVAAVQPKSEFDLAERRQHWSYQPVKQFDPPPVRQADWVASPLDAFILAKLEAAGLKPAPPADRRTLIRRVTFDLVGLPPTPEEVEAFVNDSAPDAFERLVERLLASPHYGERWGRHWLDLVRYAETLGHEFDYELYNAWRYRDYVVRAFNNDVPYDQFVIEHLAGDLLPQPRRSGEGYNESILGTGFFFLGEGKHSPVNIRQEQADRIDNQIDVLSKAFLAQTIACARCHDHKFDCITAADYYALFGYLKSTRYQQAPLDSPQRLGEKTAKLAEVKAQIEAAARKTQSSDWQRLIAEMPTYLIAATRAGSQAGQDVSDKAPELDAQRLQLWSQLVSSKEAGQSEHPLFAWSRLALAAPRGADFAAQAKQLRAALEQQQAEAARRLEASELFDDFNRATYSDWFVVGDAFSGGPTRAAEAILGTGMNESIGPWVAAGQAHSGRLSKRLEGSLRSRSFTIEHPYVHIRAAGQGGRINLVIDGFKLIRSPIYGGLTFELKDERLTWRTIDVSMWQGHRGYFELLDTTMPNPTTAMSEEAKQGRPADHYLCVDEIRFSPDSSPPSELSELNLQVLRDPLPESPEELARRYAAALQSLVSQRFTEPPKDSEMEPAVGGALTLANAILASGLLESEQPQISGPSESDDRLASLLEEYRPLEAALPAPTYGLAAADGTGEDEHVFLRGNYKTPGDVAPRRLSEVLYSGPQPTPQGSGRLELAQRLVDPSNPLLARVMVNRIWQHHFGQGLVRTPDDFGLMGQPPTHPELLDYLAAEFVRGGWSIKRMHRLMLNSSTYQMSSRAESAAEQADPDNRLLHCQPLRRLEAEAIRDAVLAVSGRLDHKLYGPSVPPHLTAFMEGRGRPSVSGPLDGDGRRSLYINVRRNFLTPMFLAFDYPIPFSTMGRRSVSNVPAQALAMMNGPFIAQEARRWAESVLAGPDESAEERVQSLYAAAFARRATDEEVSEALQFLAEQSRRYGQGADEPRAWADLCHVLLNVKEFIFLN